MYCLVCSVVLLVVECGCTSLLSVNLWLPPPFRTKSKGRPGVFGVHVDVLQPRKSPLAGTQGCHEETEI